MGKSIAGGDSGGFLSISKSIEPEVSKPIAAPDKRGRAMAGA